MPFDDPKEKKRKTGLKIDNSKSTVPEPKLINTANFDKQASEAFSKVESYKMRMLDLTSKFKAMVEDHILPDNKSIISRDLEKEVVDKLVAVASEMNEDQNQPESLGSVVLATLALKMLLLQRDTINSLLYKIDKLEKSNKKLEQTNNPSDAKKST
jgi:hypothetical protein